MGTNGQRVASRVFVVDEDEVLREVLVELLVERGYDVAGYSSAERLFTEADLGSADAVLSDVLLPGLGGEELLSRLEQAWPDLAVVMLSGHADVSMAVRCLQAGAYDFQQKPLDEEVLLAAVRRATEHTRLGRRQRELEARLQRPDPTQDGAYGMVGTSLAMKDLYRQIEVVLTSEAPALIRGETGSGKELVARAIHNYGPRADGPFVAVNAGAIPDTLLSSELFGHAKGAFTGAAGGRAGRLASASRGTLLLDEVESLGAAAQVQLLRVLEDGVMMRLGADEPRRVDIRLITASKEDVPALVQKGILREDFFHRVVVLSVEIPPLRARREDIPLLAGFFLSQIARRTGERAPHIPGVVLDSLVNHDWPGNVRELRNAMERMFATTLNGRVGEFVPIGGAPKRLLSLPTSGGRLRDALERVERETINAAMLAEGGQVASAARRLGISRRALYQRLGRYGIDASAYR